MDGVRRELDVLRESLERSGMTKRRKAEIMLEAQQSAARAREKAGLRSETYLKLDKGGQEEEKKKEMEEKDFFRQFLEVGEPSGDVPRASAAVALRRSSAAGRHAAAARDVDAGEVLLVDDPVVFALLPGFAHVRCAVCAAGAPGGAPLPCGGCASVVFCSEECREASRERYVGTPTISASLLLPLLLLLLLLLLLPLLLLLLLLSSLLLVQMLR